jgi:hypothetical protein
VSTAGAPTVIAPALGYAAPEYAAPRTSLYRIAQVCWAAPLVFGVALLVLYAITFERRLPTLGLLTLLGGAVMLFVGLVSLLTFKGLLPRCAPDVRATWSKRSSVLLVLLLLNIPASIACALAGLHLMSRFPVTLVNASSAAITDITVTAPGETVQIARLDPGEKRRVLLRVTADGEVTFSATQNSAPLSGIASGYVTSGPANGRSQVRFTEAGPVVRED